MDEMLTTAPPPSARASNALRSVARAASTFNEIVRRNISESVSRMDAFGYTPAQLTRTSNPPRNRNVSETTNSAEPATARSARIAQTRAPESDPARSMAFAACSSWWYEKTTSKPLFAKCVTMAAPIPREPPVTSTRWRAFSPTSDPWLLQPIYLGLRPQEPSSRHCDRDRSSNYLSR